MNNFLLKGREFIIANLKKAFALTGSLSALIGIWLGYATDTVNSIETFIETLLQGF